MSNGQSSKILRKFEDKDKLKSRRRKIMKLTPKGIEKTDAKLKNSII